MEQPSFDLSNPNRTIHAGVILLNSTTEILDVAPFHLMGSIGKHVKEYPDSKYPPEMKSQALDIEHHWISESGQPAQLTAGMQVVPTDTFETCPPLDILLIGASGMSYVPSTVEIAFLRKSYEDCSAFIAVCGGFQAPRLAGLLHGKTATAPLSLLEKLRRESPETNWVAERWHCDGRLWTTGQLVNGLDAMRAFAELVWGGRGALIEKILDEGCWPARDVYYGDYKAK